jgi:hypothetical protein
MPKLIASAFKSHAEEIAHIDAFQKGFAETPANFSARVSAARKSADAIWGVKRGSGALAVVMSDEDQLEKLLIEGLKAEFLTWDGVRATFKENQFGHPFAPCKYIDGKGKMVVHKEVPERYRLWPKQRAQLGLLFFLCTCVLCAPETSTSNESFHSIAAYILRSLRRSLTPSKAEAYSIMKKTLPKQLKAQQTVQMQELEQQAIVDGFLDTAAVDALLDDEPVASSGGAGGAAAAASSSDGGGGGSGAAAAAATDEVELLDDDADAVGDDDKSGDDVRDY